MLDQSMFGQTTNSNTEIFQYTGSSQWLAWVKPRGPIFAQFLCVGGGGGGGGGATRASGNSGGGGGGGGGAAITTVIVPLFLLPDVIYLQIGQGGAGGAAGADGSSGSLSYVSIIQDTQATNLIAVSGSTVADNGFAGGTFGGSASLSGAVSAIANMCLAGYGFFQSYTATTGGGGGNPDSNGSGIASTNSLTSGGCGGAGVVAADTAGGGYSSTSRSYLVTNSPKAPAAGSFNGSAGYAIFGNNSSPLCFYAGCGGSGSDAGIGGNGGDGGPGCGGGGGGAGTTGGRGGSGGNGIIIINTW